MKRKIIDVLFIIYGLSIWATPIIAYIVTWYYSIKLFLLPLIQLYGFWSWLGMVLALTAAAYASTFTFFWMISKFKSPKTIIEEHTNA